VAGGFEQQRTVIAGARNASPDGPERLHLRKLIWGPIREFKPEYRPMPMPVAAAAACARFVQPLEARRLFAAAPVNINGTDARDFIVVSTTASTVTVTVNDVPQTFAQADVSALNIFAGGGDDIVIATGATFGFYLDCGDGDDKVLGGDGPDTILGGAQKDQIYGGLGNDRLNGSGGNDKVLGEAGADRLYAGDGNDFVDGGSSGDRIYAGDGLDTLLGQGGNDNFAALDEMQDIVYGGSGTDTAFVDAVDVRGSLERVALV
jgi:Ca2+-binding RTX toxin-like protein